MKNLVNIWLPFLALMLILPLLDTGTYTLGAIMFIMSAVFLYNITRLFK